MLSEKAEAEMSGHILPVSPVGVCPMLSVTTWPILASVFTLTYASEQIEKAF